jgi:hypothetical protein
VPLFPYFDLALQFVSREPCLPRYNRTLLDLHGDLLNRRSLFASLSHTPPILTFAGWTPVSACFGGAISVRAKAAAGSTA